MSAAATAVTPRDYAARAARAYTVMRRRFATRSGLMRRDGPLPRPRARAHLWPFIRAMVATLDLAGVPAGLLPEFDADAAIATDLAVLERYWQDDRRRGGAYASDIPGTLRGGDRYYDDNAWVGLALVQLARVRPGESRLDRAAAVLAFARGGWDRRAGVPSPGGVFWVEQDRGIGRRNHDRNTVSTAPNAQLALHLRQLHGAADGTPQPQEMCDWVNAALHAGPGAVGTGLFWDKIRGDGTLDRALWSYNQGNMIGANVLLAREGGGEFLQRAEAIARVSLAHYEHRYGDQPPAFNAIFFRNLLALHAATADQDLRRQILGALRAYAQELHARPGPGRLRGGAPLLDCSALVSIPALLAWDPGDYGKLA